LRIQPISLSDKPNGRRYSATLKRDFEIEVLDRPQFLRSNLIHGVRDLPVQIH
jgi:hypothetical protein